jgi:hypothetical protein
MSQNQNSGQPMCYKVMKALFQQQKHDPNKITKPTEEE